MKVVINKQYGGFGLSHKGVMEYARLKGLTLYPEIDDICKRVYKEKATFDNLSMVIHYTIVPFEEYKAIADKEREKPVGVGRFEKSNALYFSPNHIPRTDPLLIQIVETMGKEANGRCATLEIVEIPDGTDYDIDEYDGMEHIAEKYRTWG